MADSQQGRGCADAGGSTRRPRAIVIVPAESAQGAERGIALSSERSEVLGAVLVDNDGVACDDVAGVIGTTSELEALHERLGFDIAVLRLPVESRWMIMELSRRLAKLGVAVRILPPESDLLGEHWHASRVVAEQVGTDSIALLGRKPARTDHALLSDMLDDARVLVTGAGGSIGSELARLCASYDPEAVILIDRSENALFEIERQITLRAPGLAHQAILHDIVDAESTRRLFESLRPDIVIHAAAHKHVPLMEDHPAAAVENNLFGTRSVLDASVGSGVGTFVMISTDKAVNPSSVMGATKRAAELYVRAVGGASPTRCRIVRFGNVLGSACSVVPIWEKQLSERGFISVTDERMERYFMTIPEAASLVLHAAALEDPDRPDADVYVLDMGAPVRIIDLARRYLALRGIRPRVLGRHETKPLPDDLTPPMIHVTGIRRGEKLVEELTYDVEDLHPTPVPKVMAWAGERPERAGVERMLADLIEACRKLGSSPVCETLERHVPHVRHAGEPIVETAHPRIRGRAPEAA